MTPATVLLVHNRYRHRGGEDEVVEAEAALLRARGHRVELFERDNRDVCGGAAAALQAVWSVPAWRALAAAIDALRPQVMHVHNTFPLISPAAYWAAARRGVAVVQTLHNFRLACIQAMFLREGRVCERCLGRAPWPGVVGACYRGSYAQSAAAGAALGVHRLLRTYQRKVHRYIALNRFCRDKFVQAGLPPRRLCIKPNFVDLPAPADGPRRGALFVGRLSPEKGTRVLAQALELVPGLSLTVIGGGPDEALLRGREGVVWRGPTARGAVYAAMGAAAFLVMPSIWYENHPRTLVEAYACGLPVIAGRIGAMEELVAHERTGLLCEPGSAPALARALRWALDHPGAMRRMGFNARAEYEHRYGPDRNYDRLMSIYTQARDELYGRSGTHGYTTGPQGHPHTRDTH